MKGATMIIPHGIPDLLRYGRKQAMTYNISGVKPGEVGGKNGITMDLEEAYQDTMSGINIMVHHIRPTYENGHAKPTINGDAPGGLTDETTVFSLHRINTIDAPGAHAWRKDTSHRKFADLVNGGWFTGDPGIIDCSSAFPTAAASHSDPNAPTVALGGGGNLRNAGVLIGTGSTIRRVQVIASSAILGQPGAGELLIGYPFTGVSTSHAEERMRIQLRCYLGAALYQPDSVLILNNVFVEGVENVRYFTFLNALIEEKVNWMCGHLSRTAPIVGGVGHAGPPNAWALGLQHAKWCWDETFGDPEVVDAIKFIYYDEWEQLVQESGLTGVAGGGPTHANGLGAAIGVNATGAMGPVAGTPLGYINPNAPKASDFIKAFLKLPVRMMRDGATFGTGLPAGGPAAGTLVDPNTGEFGVLDDPFKYVNLHGAPQAYDSLSAGDSAALQHR
jgi:hypothetical protein